MDENKNDVSENMNDDLSKIAYNIVPEGADYDVFSENVKSSEKGVLLHSEISSPTCKSKSKTESSESEQESGGASSAESKGKNAIESADDSSENSGMEYDVFSENTIPNSDSKKPINREYLDRIYDGGLEFSEDTILMTRSDYISAYNRIEENYREAKQEILKDCLSVSLVAAFSVILFNFLTYLRNNIMSFVVTNVLTMAVIACRLGSIILCAFLVISLIKKYIKAKKARQKSLDLLERKKKDLMLLGLYDLSN